MIVVHVDKKAAKKIPDAAKKKAVKLAGEASKRAAKMEFTPGFIKAERRKVNFAKSTSLIALGFSAAALAVAVVALSRTGAISSLESHFHEWKDSAARAKDAAIHKKDELVEDAKQAGKEAADSLEEGAKESYSSAS